MLLLLLMAPPGPPEPPVAGPLLPILLRSSFETLPAPKALGPSPAAPSILSSGVGGACSCLTTAWSTFISFCSLGGSGLFSSFGGGGGGGGGGGVTRVILGGFFCAGLSLLPIRDIRPQASKPSTSRPIRTARRVLAEDFLSVAFK
jgi:hypothetical protein